MPRDPDDMDVPWWTWGEREETIRNIHGGDDSSSGVGVLTVGNLPQPTPPSGTTGLTFSQLRAPAIRFRVVDRLPIPPVLQVKLFLRHNPSFALQDGEEYNDQSNEKYYTLCATTTYLAPTSSPTTTSPPLAPPPITVQLHGAQEHLTASQSRRDPRSGRSSIVPKPVAADVSTPIFGIHPSLHNLRIVDAVTGEDLVHVHRSTHPQPHALDPSERQFLTLYPGDSVTRDVARLPYPDRSRRAPPREGEPGFYMPRVRDMQSGRKYKITLRGGRVEDGGKGFWWREGTREDVFAGVEGEEGWDGDQRKRTAVLRRRVMRNLQLPLHMQSEDEIVVECPAGARWREQ
ncbi:hypothetical protein Micbo1qcDRAFT_207758 [Microdochium bolleyi]|uniref:Uncharacterized protein n=1 Tax=Microdochium bolleyi TaxID=196109 RepID=A0A136IT05_9PEZI|nr:hypothetical protein Micbo1qcDRAFT_207758 [Microdochium bolleyi]